MFANKGYQAATTREICDAAQCNMAAIHYHFGDKAGLYKAVLLLPLEQFSEMTAGFDAPNTGNFTDKIRALYAGLLAPLRNPDPIFTNHMRLHFREMIEPSELGQEIMSAAFLPFFQRTAQLLLQELKLEQPNDDVYRLTFATIGMAMDFFTSSNCTNNLSPNLLNTPDKIDLLVERLSGYATGMLAFEKQRLKSLEQ